MLPVFYIRAPPREDYVEATSLLHYEPEPASVPLLQMRLELDRDGAGVPGVDLVQLSQLLSDFQVPRVSTLPSQAHDHANPRGLLRRQEHLEVEAHRLGGAAQGVGDLGTRKLFGTLSGRRILRFPYLLLGRLHSQPAAKLQSVKPSSEMR